MTLWNDLLRLKFVIFFKDERTWHWTRWKTHLLRTTLRNVRQPVIPTWASWLLSLQICSLRTCEWSSSLFVKVRWFSISLQDSLHLTNYFSWQSWGWAMEIFLIKRFLLLESLIHDWLTGLHFAVLNFVKLAIWAKFKT